MSRITREAFEELGRSGVPLAVMLDFQVVRLESGSASVRMPFHENTLRPGGTISGPALVALADYTMYAVVLSAIGQVELAVTTNLNVNFLRRPEPTDIIAEGTLLKLGRRLAVCEIALYSPATDELVAHVTGTYSIPPLGRMSEPTGND